MKNPLDTWLSKPWNRAQRMPFPRWVDHAVKVLGLIAVAGGGYVTMLVAYGASPKTLAVGYAPEQPVPYSHKLHVGELGLDCRYCHTSVETTAKANIPPTSTCMNCHSMIRTDSAKLAPVRESHASGRPVEWVRVHSVSDYAYFNHSAHVSRGIGCVSCHGRIDTMDVVYQTQPLSMAWCVDCHRHPEKNLRPPAEATNMTWQPTDATGDPMDPFEFGKQFAEDNNINPPTDCSTCHR